MYFISRCTVFSGLKLSFIIIFTLRIFYNHQQQKEIKKRIHEGFAPMRLLRNHIHDFLLGEYDGVGSLFQHLEITLFGSSCQDTLLSQRPSGVSDRVTDTETFVICKDRVQDIYRTLSYVFVRNICRSQKQLRNL